MIRLPWTRRTPTPEPAAPTTRFEGSDYNEDPEPDHDPAADRVQQLAAEAADEGMVADAVAVYGSLHDGYDQARQQQRAALEVLPGLPPSVAARVAELQEYKRRPITLAEVRWLEHVDACANPPAPEQESADETGQGA